MLLCADTLLADVFSTADGYYEDALSHHRKKDYPTAIIQLKNALQLDNDHLPAKILLGESLLGSGEAQAAEAQLHRARKQGADENLIAVPMANSLLSQSKYQALEDYIARARRSPGVDSKLYVILGISFTQQQKFKEAEDAFNKARQLDPANPEPLLAQGSIALNNDDLDRVEQIISQLRILSPQSTVLWLLEGDLYTRRNKPGQALQAYEKILRLNPESVTAILRRARILLERGELERVIADLQPLWDEELYDPEAIYLYSMALARSGDTIQATKVLEEASRKIDYLGANIVDKHPTLALLSATIAYHQGDKMKALEAAEKLIDRLPSHGPTRMLLAQIYMDLDQPEEVINTLEPVSYRNEHNPEFLTLYGRALVKLEQFSRAIPVLESAAGLSQHPAELLSEIALAKMASGKSKAAVDDLELAYKEERYDTRAGILLAYSRLSAGNTPGAETIATELLKKDPANPVVHNLQGTIAASRGQLEAAKKHFQKALIADSTYTPALMNLVKFDLQEERLSSAGSRLQRVLDIDPESREAMAGMAKLAELQNDMHTASQWLEKLWLKHPDALPEIFQLIKIYLRTDQGDKALRTAEQLQDKHQRDFGVLMALLDTQLYLGKRSDAIETINKRLRYTVDFNVAQLVQLAKVQIRVEDSQGAHSTLSRCLLQQPDYIPAKTELIKLETQLRNYQLALTLVEEVIAAQPDSALGYSLKGDVLVFSGKNAEALEIFEQTNEKWPSTHLHLKILKQRFLTDRSREALSQLEKWVAQRPADVEARFGLAVAYIDIGAYDRAIELHLSLLEELQRDASIHNNLAWLYQRTLNKRALEHAEKALKLAPDDPDILDTYGWILAEAGQLDTGLSYIRKALSRASQDPAARYHLALVLSKLDRKNEARDALRELLAEENDFRESSEAKELLSRLEKG